MGYIDIARRTHNHDCVPIFILLLLTFLIVIALGVALSEVGLSRKWPFNDAFSSLHFSSLITLGCTIWLSVNFDLMACKYCDMYKDWNHQLDLVVGGTRSFSLFIITVFALRPINLILRAQRAAGKNRVTVQHFLATAVFTGLFYLLAYSLIETVHKIKEYLLFPTAWFGRSILSKIWSLWLLYLLDVYW